MKQVVITKKIMLLTVILFCLPIFVFNAYTQESPLKLEAQSDRVIYGINDEVSVTVLLRNLSDEYLDVVEPAINKRSIQFEIIDPDGKKDKILDIQDSEPQIVRLPPKKRFRFTGKFTPEITGNYQVVVRYYGFGGQVLEAVPLSIFVVNRS